MLSKSLSVTKDNLSVSRVRTAFKNAVRNRFNRWTEPRVTTKACVEFQKLANDVSMTLDDLMLQAIEMYPAEFCQKVFKTPFCPFNVATSEKSRGKLWDANHKKVLKLKDYKRVAYTYVDALQDIDNKTAIDCVKGGWPDGPQDLRDEIIKQIKRR